MWVKTHESQQNQVPSEGLLYNNNRQIGRNIKTNDLLFRFSSVCVALCVHHLNGWIVGHQSLEAFLMVSTVFYITHTLPGLPNLWIAIKSNTGVQRRIVLRPPYISRANWFWSFTPKASLSLFWQCPEWEASFIRSCLYSSGHRTCSRSDVEKMGVPPACVRASLTLLTEILPPLLVLLRLFYWSEALKQFLEAFQKGSGERGDKPHDIFATDVFYPIVSSRSHA